MTAPRAPCIILVRPQLGENIGMAARAMANFGLQDLRIVAPRDGWPNAKAVDAAVGASALVERASVFETVAGAVADLNRVAATTARQRGQAKPVLSPVDAMADWAGRAAAGQAVGVLFGPERTGLANEEVALADAIVSFPVDPAHSSLNLAQAVSLMAYEWRKTALGGAAPFAIDHETPPASREALLAFFAYLEDELATAGYFVPSIKRPIMARNLNNILRRADLTEQDVRTLRGMVAALVRGRGRVSAREAEPE